MGIEQNHSLMQKLTLTYNEPMEPEDKTLDHLESQIPEMAQVAFKKAYWDALSSGQSVMVQEGDNIVVVHPDGTKDFKKKAPPRIKLTEREFTIK